MEPGYIKVMTSSFHAVALVLVVGDLACAYRRRRVAWGYRFGTPLWAEQSRMPVVFWGIVTLYVTLAGWLAYLLLAGES